MIKCPAAVAVVAQHPIVGRECLADKTTVHYQPSFCTLATSPRSAVPVDMVDGKKAQIRLSAALAHPAIATDGFRLGSRQPPCPLTVDLRRVRRVIAFPAPARFRVSIEARSAKVRMPIFLGAVPVELGERLAFVAGATSLHGALLYHIAFCKQWAADPTNPANDITAEIPT